MSKQANLIKALLAGKSATFAAIEYVTPVTLAAAHKKAGVVILKSVKANVQLFANIKAYTDVYTNAVKKSASKIEGNDQAKVENFEKSDNWFSHADAECFSLVSHNKTNEQYLFARFFKSEADYTINGVQATKQEVAQYLTKSAAEALLAEKSTVYNAKNDIEHDVIIRTIKLENVVSVQSGAKIEF